MKYLKLLIICIYFIPNTPAQFWDETAKLEASDKDFLELFGSSVSISGDYAIVGTPWGGELLSGWIEKSIVGAAYIFKKDENGDWAQVQKLMALDRQATNRLGRILFGSAVAINGDYAVVTAPYESRDALSGNPVGRAGAAYIFERTAHGHWEEVQKVVTSDRTAGDLFGISASLSGNTLIIGAGNEAEDVAGGNTLDYAGSAYVFERDKSGHWEEVQKIVASDRAEYANFGYAVSISGSTTLVGGRGENKSAYIFERDAAGRWYEIQRITTSDKGVFSNFGSSVSIHGDYLVVGADREVWGVDGKDSLLHAGAAYIFERDARGHWQETQKLVASDRFGLDHFGISVAIDCNYVVVGASKEDEDEWGHNSLFGSGSAYVFERGATGKWLEVQKIVASDRFLGDFFSNAVAISGNHILVGASHNDNPLLDAGAAYIFEFPEKLVRPEEDSAAAFIPYPNPNSGEVYIDLKKCYHSIDVGVRNILGQTIFAQKFEDKSRIQLELGGVAGIYLLDIHTEAKSETLKIVKR